MKKSYVMNVTKKIILGLTFCFLNTFIVAKADALTKDEFVAQIRTPLAQLPQNIYDWSVATRTDSDNFLLILSFLTYEEYMQLSKKLKDAIDLMKTKGLDTAKADESDHGGLGAGDNKNQLFWALEGMAKSLLDMKLQSPVEGHGFVQSMQMMYYMFSWGVSSDVDVFARSICKKFKTAASQ